MPRIAIIDANNLIYRSFHGIQPLTTSTGLHVNAVYGALKSIKSMVNQIKMDYIVAIWDNGKKTFRSELDPNYKAHRPAAPDNLKMQFAFLKEAFDCLGIPQITAGEKIEGDDLTGTMATKAASMGMEAIIVSADKDFFQLCENPLIKVFSFHVAKKYPDKPFVDEEYIIKNYEVKANQLIEVKSLTGEKADNIQGIPGIGPKTANKLILQYGNLNGLLNALEKDKNHKYYFIYEQKEVALLALELARINTDVEVDEIPIKPVDRIKVDEIALRNYFKKYEMESFLGPHFPFWRNLFSYATTV